MIRNAGRTVPRGAPHPAPDTLLSPRRRLLLQGLSAAALAAGSGGRAPAPPAIRGAGPPMGTTHTV